MKNHRSVNRREFIAEAAGGAMLAGVGGTVPATVAARSQSDKADKKRFRLWAMGCAHVGTDLRRGKRESLADAIRHSERGADDDGFDWDIAVHLGDLSGSQGYPTDQEGREVVRQFAAARRHHREQFYNVAGNHDATPEEGDAPAMGWFRKWADPTGENRKFSGVNAARRPYPVEGTWERYSFRVGNMLFLMMSDRNDGPPPIGCRGRRGGYPAGAVTGETFDWWKRQVQANPDAIIVTAHHHMLKETTVASGPWEGFTRTADGKYKSHYHGYFPEGAPKGASYLYFVDGKPDAQRFERYLADNPGAIDLWLGGHTHTNPDDRKGGRSHVERKWGANFINVAALTRYHVSRTSAPMSRLLTFEDGSDKVRVQCYLHTSQFAAQGWYAKARREIRLNSPFRLT